MNKLYLVISMLLMGACSSKEDKLHQEKGTSLIKVEHRKFEEGVLYEKVIIEFENNKPILYSFYDDEDQLLYTSEWRYSEDNYLASVADYSSEGALQSQTKITYDALNRIIKTATETTDSTYFSSVKFTHNNNHTIISEANMNGFEFTRIFEINSDGLIYKETEDGEVTVLAEYDNAKTISSKSATDTYNYSYLKKGAFPFSFDQIFGKNRINIVLFYNSLAFSMDFLTASLVTKITSKSCPFIEKYVYTLNENNFPLSKKEYYRDEIQNEFYYTYE